jgi:tRNA(Ile)-lysidine synthetase-like protein
MDIELLPGTYIVAVSGGVDSMALLDVLLSKYHGSPHVRLVIAHYDHGIRDDSSLDRRLVQAVADRFGAAFVYDEGKLGPGASEEVAREARYAFLRRVQTASGAAAVITAHHQDDVLETAIHNLLRGTNRRGITSLKSNNGVLRPLLHVPKRDIITHAQERKLRWIEDITNQDTRYRRNRIRHAIIPKLNDKSKSKLIDIVKTLSELNDQIDALTINYLHTEPARDLLTRRSFIMLPHNVAREVLATWLRSHGLAGFDQRTLERLVVGAKTFKPGKRIDIYDGYQLEIQKENLALRQLDR